MTSAARLLLAAVLAIALGSVWAAPATAADNVLVLLLDDVGQGEILAHQIPMPNLDRLAREGVTFTNAYSGDTLCAPTRAGLVTGRYPQRFGFYRNQPYGSGPGDPKYRAFGLPPSQKTFADILQGRGYATGLVGKWHLGFDDFEQPYRRGFADTFYFRGGERTYYDNDRDPDHVMRRGPAIVHFAGYTTRAFGAEAEAFIRRHAGGGPWALELAFNAAHVPITADPSTVGRCGRFTGKRRTFCSMLASVDDELGDLLGALEATGQRGRTLVAFAGDNGCTNDEQGCILAPFSGHKRSYLEGGIRVPLVLSQPGTLPQGTRFAPFVVTTDIAATAVSAAGAAIPANMDGVDLVHAVAAGTVPHAVWHWGYPNDGATRAGDWKLLVHPSGGPQLFNLASDPGEHRNLAGGNAALVAHLRDLRAGWASQLQRPGW